MTDKISNKTLHELEELSDTLLETAQEHGIVYAETKAHCEDMEDKRKSVLASLANKFDGAQSTREDLARAHPDYTQFLDALKASRESFYKAQVFWDLIKVKIDLIRTAISNRREEIKKFQGK